MFKAGWLKAITALFTLNVNDTTTLTAGASLKTHNLVMMVIYKLRSRFKCDTHALNTNVSGPQAIVTPNTISYTVYAVRVTAVNTILEDQMAFLKAPLSRSKEIYSSGRCMCRISLGAALTTVESGTL